MQVHRDNFEAQTVFLEGAAPVFPQCELGPWLLTQLLPHKPAAQEENAYSPPTGVPRHQDDSTAHLKHHAAKNPACPIGSGFHNHTPLH